MGRVKRNVFLAYSNREDPAQPVYPCSLIRAFDVLIRAFDDAIGRSYRANDNPDQTARADLGPQCSGHKTCSL